MSDIHKIGAQIRLGEGLNSFRQRLETGTLRGKEFTELHHYKLASILDAYPPT